MTTCGFPIVLFCSGSWVVAVFQLGQGGDILPALRPSGIFVVSLKTASDSRRQKRCLRKRNDSSSFRISKRLAGEVATVEEK